MLTAEVASACAAMIILSFSNLALSTSYLKRSAFCCATCLDSMARCYSGLKVKFVILVSSSWMQCSIHLSPRLRWIRDEIWSRCVSSWLALYCEIIDLLTSCTRLERTTSRKSGPRLRCISCILVRSGLTITRIETSINCKSLVPVLLSYCFDSDLILYIYGLSKYGIAIFRPSKCGLGLSPVNLLNLIATWPGLTDYRDCESV